MNSQTSTDLPAIRKSNDTFATFNQIQDMIRERAFRIFNDRNLNEGDALSDWLNAESEVLSDIDLKLGEDPCSVVIDGSVKGFLPDEIEVRVKDGVFEVAGIHTEESSSKEGEVTKAALKQMSFFRSFKLPDSLNTDKMEVNLDCGRFTAKIPKVSHEVIQI
jgi:HSP20 family molecular chaperone IbpA